MVNEPARFVFARLTLRLALTVGTGCICHVPVEASGLLAADLPVRRERVALFDDIKATLSRVMVETVPVPSSTPNRRCAHARSPRIPTLRFPHLVPCHRHLPRRPRPGLPARPALAQARSGCPSRPWICGRRSLARRCTRSSWTISDAPKRPNLSWTNSRPLLPRPVRPSAEHTDAHPAPAPARFRLSSRLPSRPPFRVPHNSPFVSSCESCTQPTAPRRPWRRS